jgi:DNA helicase II / ATP-dependent DNA helicase PcrA
MLDLTHLDQDQMNAVTAPDGVVCVFAGAGTGKTTTLQCRAANLLATKKAVATEMMLVTFTNKSAAEIRHRVAAAIGRDAEWMRMGTFHSLSLKILRKYAELTGLQSERFTIADDDDVKQLIDQAIDDAGVYPAFMEPDRPEGMKDPAYKALVKAEKKEWDATRKEYLKEALYQIPRWKECGLHITEARRKESTSILEGELIRVYDAYQTLLDSYNMCDFSDLILRVVHLFDEHPEIAEAEAKAIRHLLVDEFQDTNMLQFRWLTHLTSYWGNLFVVGDTDQSLYSFRGSAPGIMARLLADAVRVVSLKTNRRCTQEILEPANRLVDINPRTDPKVLDSAKRGDAVSLMVGPNEFAEAKMVAAEVKRLVALGTDPAEIAILGRASFVLKPVEKELLKAGVPYALLGGGSILDKEEIKDMLAYLKMAIDPSNELAFQRIANKPVRGCGPSTVKFILDTARAQRVNFADACHLVASEAVKGPAKKNVLEDISKFATLLSGIALSYEMGVPPAAIVDRVYEDTGYKDHLKEKKEDWKARDRNIEFLRSYAAQYEDLCEFVQEVALTSDAIDEGDGVRLGTIHSSKGLEFDHVFLPGWEEGVFPSPRASVEVPGDIDDPWLGPPIGGVEEERRIAHVAITRARKTVAILRAAQRAGKRPLPSRFLKEAGVGRGRSAQYAPDFDESAQDMPKDTDFSPIKFPSSVRSSGPVIRRRTPRAPDMT